MNLFATDTTAEPLEVVVAGAGVAGLETMLALHHLAGPRVRVRLVAPNDEFVDPALAVAVPFGLAEPHRIDVGKLAIENGATHLEDTVVAVHAERRTVVTGRGRELPYDAFVLATGGRRRPALAGALTFGVEGAIDRFKTMLAGLVAGDLRRVAFAVPRGVAWALPAYELALLTATYLAAHGVRGAELSLVTAERIPLAVFGRRASDRVTGLLREAGIALRTVAPERLVDGRLDLARGEPLEVDEVVSLPYLNPPEVVGVPSNPRGLIPVDRHGRVEGLEDVYAAGDATSYPINQGGLAAQQADAVALAIAARAGAPVTADAFRPVLRGALLTGDGVEYLRHRPSGAEAAPSETALWWPATKVAARYLGPVLAGDADDGLTRTLDDVGEWQGSAERGVLAMALEAADADAGWGDYAGALRWLAVAEQLAIVLPAEYAHKRERWRDAVAGVATGRSHGMEG